MHKLAREAGRKLVNPVTLARRLTQSGEIQAWAHSPATRNNARLGRITFYDALPDDAKGKNPEREQYWRAIELLEDVHLGFGALRGLSKQPRQKGVDTLIAVDMVVGAFSSLFDIAILVSGDADFVPVVEEVKRRRVMVAVAASPKSLSESLRRVADRFIELPVEEKFFKAMEHEGKTWDP